MTVCTRTTSLAPGIIASNGATLALPTNLGTSSQLPNAVTNVDAGGTLYFPSAGQANNYSGQFYGGAVDFDGTIDAVKDTLALDLKGSLQGIYFGEMLRGTDEKHAQAVRDIELFRMKKMQAYIAIRGSENASENADVPSDRMALHSRVTRPVINYRVGKTRWCVLRWPSPSMLTPLRSRTASAVTVKRLDCVGTRWIRKPQLPSGCWRRSSRLPERRC